MHCLETRAGNEATRFHQSNCRVGSMAACGAREAVCIMKAFSNELQRNGYIEGQNLAIDYRAWAPHIDLIADYAAELVKGQYDVIARRSEERRVGKECRSRWSPY